MAFCFDAGCDKPTEGFGYDLCGDCGEQFCPAHLLYCTQHSGQHCVSCCENLDAVPSSLK
jgi:hypothetical protein